MFGKNKLYRARILNNEIEVEEFELIELTMTRIRFMFSDEIMTDAPRKKYKLGKIKDSCEVWSLSKDKAMKALEAYLLKCACYHTKEAENKHRIAFNSRKKRLNM